MAGTFVRGGKLVGFPSLGTCMWRNFEAPEGLSDPWATDLGPAHARLLHQCLSCFCNKNGQWSMRLCGSFVVVTGTGS